MAQSGSVLDRLWINSFATELLFSGLRVMFRTDVRWEFARESPTAGLGARRDFRDRLRSDPRYTPARNDERRAVAKILRWKPMTYVAVATPLEAFQPRGRARFAEFDGVFAEPFGSAGLAIIMVEAKREVGATARTSAIRALEGKLRKFALNDGVRRRTVTSAWEGSLGWASWMEAR